MKAELKVENTNVRGISLQLGVAETLLIAYALKDFSENLENHPTDIKLALRMLDDMDKGVFQR